MTDVEDLRRQLDTAYAAIEELDEDLAAGRISTGDHADLKKASEARAAALLAKLRKAESAPRAASPVTASASTAAVGSRLRNPLALGVGATLIFIVGVGVGVLLARSATTDAVSTAGAAPMAPPAGMMPPPAATANADGQALPPGHPSQSGMNPSAPPPAAALQPPAPPSAKLDALAKEIAPEAAPTPKLLAFAMAALDEGQRAPALVAFKRVLARDPKNVQAIVGIAAILADGRFVDQALARLDEALTIDPKHAQALWMRARILLELKQDYPGAIRAAEAFLAVRPGNAAAEQARNLIAEARTRASAAKSAEAPPAATPTGGQAQ